MCKMPPGKLSLRIVCSFFEQQMLEPVECNYTCTGAITVWIIICLSFKLFPLSIPYSFGPNACHHYCLNGCFVRPLSSVRCTSFSDLPGRANIDLSHYNVPTRKSYRSVLSKIYPSPHNMADTLMYSRYNNNIRLNRQWEHAE